MGDLTICPSSDVGASVGWTGEPAAGAALGPPVGAGSGLAGPADGDRMTASLPPETLLTILTFSSPSVTSSSAIPESSTWSISFFNMRKSMLVSVRSGHASLHRGRFRELDAG